MTNTDPHKVKSKIVTITPEIAEEYLARNENNRQIRGTKVRQFAQDIKKGVWELNGEAIKFSTTGRLIDGQHRLMAVLEADTPILSLVLTGLDDINAQQTMDQGTKRTLKDALKFNEEKNIDPLAASIRIVYAYKTTGIPLLHGDMSVHAGLDVLNHHPEIRNSVKKSAPFGPNKWCGRTMISGLHYLFSQYDVDEADNFIAKVHSGAELIEKSPIYELRKRFLEDFSGPKEKRMNTKTRYALVVKAWNAWLLGEQLTNGLFYRAGGSNPEKFPAISGIYVNDKGKFERVEI